MISLRGIKVIFSQGTENEILAFQTPSLKIAYGIWCNLIGPNGSGKSTLLRILSRDVNPTSGVIVIDGQDITSQKARQVASAVQLLEQNPEKNTVPSMSVFENLILYNQQARFPRLAFLKRSQDSRVKDILARFEMGLENRLNTQVGNLSGGQKQAVALAAVLLSEPKVLLLDEFLASIDPNTAPKLLKVVRDISKERKTTVLNVSHALDHVESTGDRLIILAEGEVVDDVDTVTNSLKRQEIVARYSKILQSKGIL